MTEQRTSSGEQRSQNGSRITPNGTFIQLALVLTIVGGVATGTWVLAQATGDLRYLGKGLDGVNKHLEQIDTAISDMRREQQDLKLQIALLGGGNHPGVQSTQGK